MSLANDWSADRDAIVAQINSVQRRLDEALGNVQARLPELPAFDTAAQLLTQVQGPITSTMWRIHTAICRDFRITSGLNDPPIAVEDAGSGFEGREAFAFFTDSILANDIDVDAGDTLEIISLAGRQAVADGRLAFDPDGVFNDLATGQTEPQMIDYVIRDTTDETSESMRPLTPCLQTPRKSATT